MSAAAEHSPDPAAPAPLRPVGEAVRDDSAPPSLLDELKAERTALKEKRFLTLDIPGFTKFAARYGPIDLDEIDKLQRAATRAAAGSDSNVPYIHAAADIIARCCVELLVRDEDGKLVSLHEQPDAQQDEPIRYDENLAKLLGLEGERQRQWVESLYEVFVRDSGNDVVMMDHADDIVRWIKSGARGSDGDF